MDYVEQGLAVEVDASEELSVADVVDRAESLGVPFCVVLEYGETVGVLAVADLTPSSVPVEELARETPTVELRTVQLELPDGEVLAVDVQVQGDELAVWDRGHEDLVVSLEGLDVTAALTSRVMALAAPDTELPGPTPPLEPRYHTYVCRNRHYVSQTGDDRNRKCRKCGLRLYCV
jgi:hypothetical protein